MPENIDDILEFMFERDDAKRSDREAIELATGIDEQLRFELEVFLGSAPEEVIRRYARAAIRFNSNRLQSGLLWLHLHRIIGEDAPIPMGARLEGALREEYAKLELESSYEEKKMGEAESMWLVRTVSDLERDTNNDPQLQRSASAFVEAMLEGRFAIRLESTIAAVAVLVLREKSSYTEDDWSTSLRFFLDRFMTTAMAKWVKLNEPTQRPNDALIRHRALMTHVSKNDELARRSAAAVKRFRQERDSS